MKGRGMNAASPRKWATADGNMLVEGEPSSTDFEGVPLPGVAQAHSYELRSNTGNILKSFLPEKERLDEYKECFHLIRYQMVGEALVKFVSYCYEESTYDTPFAKDPEQTVMLEGLNPF